MQGVEQIHRLVAGLARYGGGVPEALHSIATFVSKAHMRRQLGGQPSYLAASHGIGLARHGEGGGAGLADPSGEQVGVDDAVGLVGALIGLVDPLAEEGDGLRVVQEPVVEGAQIHLA